MLKHSLQVFDVSLGRVTVAVPSTFGVKMCKHWGSRTFVIFGRRSFRWQTRRIQRLLTQAHRCQCTGSSASDNKPSSEQTLMRQKANLKGGPSLHHFIAANSAQSTSSASEPPSVHHNDENADTENVPYLSSDSFDGNHRKGSM